jgi:hypothetical protein
MEPMVRVRMLRTMNGSPDGIQVNTYEAGQVYDKVPQSLADVFLREGAAEEDKQRAGPAERKESTPEKPAAKPRGGRARKKAGG